MKMYNYGHNPYRVYYFLPNVTNTLRPPSVEQCSVGIAQSLEMLIKDIPLDLLDSV